MKNNPSYRAESSIVLLGSLFSLFLCHGVFAQSDATSDPQTAKQAEEVSEPERRFREAVERLDALDWIEADIRQTMNVGGRKFLATGRHLEGPNLKLRRELNVSVGKTTSSMLEVCDGEIFYLKHQIDETIELKQVLVKDVLEKIEEVGLDEQGKSRWLREFGLRGLAEYLRGIEQTHRFEQVEEGTWEDRRVLIFHGRWKPEVVEELAVAASVDEQGDDEASEVEGVALPENIPDEVVCYVGVENGIPYRLEFRKNTSGKGRELGIIDLINVVVGQPIADREFNYIAPSEAQDLTDQVIVRIELERAESGLNDESDSDAAEE